MANSWRDRWDFERVELGGKCSDSSRYTAISISWVLPSDAGYQCFPDDPSKVRKPDVSFIQAARLAVEDEPEGWATIAPDLAVEVISPNDLFEAVSVKVREYLTAGVRLM